jgi:hypothetical protein
LAFVGTSEVGEDSDSHSDESGNEGSESSKTIGNSDPGVSEGGFDGEEDKDSESKDKDDNDLVFLEKESISSLLDERGSFQNKRDIGLFLVGESVVSDFNFNSSKLNGVEDCVELPSFHLGNNHQDY